MTTERPQVKTPVTCLLEKCKEQGLQSTQLRAFQQAHHSKAYNCTDEAESSLRTAKGPPTSMHLISKHSPHALAGPATEKELLRESAATLQKGYDSFFSTP